jgi:hypothetical protein
MIRNLSLKIKLYFLKTHVNSFYIFPEYIFCGTSIIRIFTDLDNGSLPISPNWWGLAVFQFRSIPRISEVETANCIAYEPAVTALGAFGDNAWLLAK